MRSLVVLRKSTITSRLTFLGKITQSAVLTLLQLLPRQPSMLTLSLVEVEHRPTEKYYWQIAFLVRRFLTSRLRKTNLFRWLPLTRREIPLNSPQLTLCKKCLMEPQLLPTKPQMYPPQSTMLQWAAWPQGTSRWLSCIKTRKLQCMLRTS